jgi:hypothetical protein
MENKTCGECQRFHCYPNDLASKDRCNMFFFRDRGNNPACDRFVARLNAPADCVKQDGNHDTQADLCTADNTESEGEDE